MASLVITLIIVLISLIAFVFLRFKDLGMNWFEALERTIFLPMDIIQVYTVVLRNSQEKVKPSLLFFPVLNLPQIIVVIADFYLTKKAKILATKELLRELKGKERSILIKELKKEGIIVKRKKIVPKRQAPSNTDSISEMIYALISKRSGGDLHKHKFI